MSETMRATDPAMPTEDTLSRPFPMTMSVRDARDAYLAENGFALADYEAESVTVKAFGTMLTIPNRPSRKWAIPLHDLHHVATGYGSDIVGEGEIGAYELAAGCRRPFIYALNVAAFCGGFLLSPLRVLRAFRLGLRARTLYRHPFDYDALLAADVGTLRAHLGIPGEGFADRPRKLHHDAWNAYLARTAEGAAATTHL